MCSISDEGFVPIKLAAPQESALKIRRRHLCLCRAVGNVLFLSRLSGIWSFVACKKDEVHINQCCLEVSKKWMVYSKAVLFLYLVYFCYGYGHRFLHGPPGASGSEWYVMTIGYMVSDLDSIITIAMGIILRHKTIALFERLSELPGRAGEIRQLKKLMQIVLRPLIIASLIMFSSYIYVGWFRFKMSHDNIEYYTYDVLDTWIPVLIRGVTLMFPLIQVVVTFMFASIIWRKFEYLADTTRAVIGKLIISYSRKFKDQCQSNDEDIYVLQLTKNSTEELEKLSRTHQQISDALTELNSCVGIQLLFAFSANLYTTIYYFYRYATSADNDFTSNENERPHYVIGLAFRMGKMLTYMVMGQLLYTRSLQPLQVIQQSPLVNLPLHVQQQVGIYLLVLVQTLLMQWNGKVGYLSGFGIVKIGPWLLAPVVGNVITYLLVALQFDSSEKTAANVTAILESMS